MEENKVTRTYDEIMEYDRLSAAYKESHKGKKENKLCYAIFKIQTQLKKIVSKNNKKILDINIKHSLTDPDTKAILKDEQGQFLYSQEGMRSREKELESIVGGTEYTFIPYYTTEVPDDLSIDEREIFKGIVIAPDRTEDNLV